MNAFGEFYNIKRYILYKERNPQIKQILPCATEHGRILKLYILYIGTEKSNNAKKPFKYKCCKDDFVYLWLIEKESN